MNWQYYSLTQPEQIVPFNLIIYNAGKYVKSLWFPTVSSAQAFRDIYGGFIHHVRLEKDTYISEFVE